MSQSLREKLLNEYIELSWYSGDLSYKLHSKQAEIWFKINNLKRSESILFISRQFGKSYLSCCLAISYAIRNPNTVVRIAAPTKEQAYDIVNDQLARIITDAPKGLVKPMKSDLRWRVGSSEIRLGTVARAHIDTLRGTNASLIVLEEGGFAPSDEYKYAYESVIVPQVTKTKGSIVHVTTPSEQPEHYIHTDIIPRCKANSTFYSYTIHDNPFVTLEDIKHIASLLGGEDSLAFRREYLCEVVRDASTVCVPSFSDSHITKCSYSLGDQIVVFGDFGGSRDKTVIHFSYCDRITNKVRVLRELVFPNNTSTKVIVEAIKAMESSNNYYPSLRVFDAPAQLLIDINITYGLTCQSPLKDGWHDALNWLNVAFESNLVEIDESCVFTIKTLRSGTFNKQKSDYDRTEELGHMDAIASLTYGIKAHMVYSPNFRYFQSGGTKPRTRSDEAKDFLSNKFSVDFI